LNSPYALRGKKEMDTVCKVVASVVYKLSAQRGTIPDETGEIRPQATDLIGSTNPL